MTKTWDGRVCGRDVLLEETENGFSALVDSEHLVLWDPSNPSWIEHVQPETGEALPFTEKRFLYRTILKCPESEPVPAFAAKHEDFIDFGRVWAQWKKEAAAKYNASRKDRTEEIHELEKETERTVVMPNLTVYEIDKEDPERQSQCKSCPQTVYWAVTPKGKNMPCNEDGQSHFNTCPGADKHSGSKKGAKNSTAKETVDAKATEGVAGQKAMDRLRKEAGEILERIRALEAKSETRHQKMRAWANTVEARLKGVPSGSSTDGAG